jgi:hypothetical protein
MSNDLKYYSEDNKKISAIQFCIFTNKEIKRTYLDQYVPNINKFRKDFKFYKKLSSYNAVVKTINQLKNKQY